MARTLKSILKSLMNVFLHAFADDSTREAFEARFAEALADTKSAATPNALVAAQIEAQRVLRVALTVANDGFTTDRLPAALVADLDAANLVPTEETIAQLTGEQVRTLFEAATLGPNETRVLPVVTHRTNAKGDHFVDTHYVTASRPECDSSGCYRPATMRGDKGSSHCFDCTKGNRDQFYRTLQVPRAVSSPVQSVAGDSKAALSLLG